MKMDEFFHKHWQQKKIAKNWTKKKWWKSFMLVCFEILVTWNAEVIFHISSIWNILSSATSKTYKMLN
jgi:hypothetical protein